MPADANIFQAYLQPPKSVQDYQAAYDQADQRKNALQMAAMDLGERQQTLQRQQTVRNALMSLGATASDDERVNALRATATPEGYAQADALVKTQMERQKTAAQVGKDTAQAGHFTAQTADQVYKTRIAKSEQAIKDIAGFTSPQEALASLEAHAAAGDVDPQKAAMIRATIPQDPAQFPQWQLGMLRNIMAAKDQIAQVSPDANARLQAQTSTANNAATNATSRANNAATNATHLTAAGMGPGGGMDDNSERTAQAIASGQLPAPTGMALLNPKNQRILGRVMEINPQYDATTVSAKKTAAASFASGPLGNALRSVSTANAHLDQLGELADALKTATCRSSTRCKTTSRRRPEART
jgi:hypothetical protein